jgi:methionyl-tRNA formyltransferase
VGKIVTASAAGIDCSTGKGELRLLQLQRPGGRPVSARDYLNARPLQTGLANDGAADAGMNPGR